MGVKNNILLLLASEVKANKNTSGSSVHRMGMKSMFRFIIFISTTSSLILKSNDLLDNDIQLSPKITINFSIIQNNSDSIC